MKKALFALISVLAVTFSAQAQFGFGAKGGLSLTNLIGGGAPHDVMFNYHVGAFVEYRFSNHLAISPEVLFSAQGGSHKLSDIQIGDIITESTKQKWTTNYVTVPVMLKLYATDRLSIDLGPQFGFNVTSKGKTQSDNFEANSVDIKDFTETFELSAGLGITYYITHSIFIQGRYTIGLTKTYDSGVLKDTELLKDAFLKNARNGVGQISIGIKL